MRRGGLRSAKLQIANRRSQAHQRGYMLITLMLAFALMALALLAILPDIQTQIRRDHENELRHRGTAYMRAIQHFYRKFGRYPTRVEELENTNNIRFLRKRYKDPVSRDPATGKEREFKLLHQTDISLNSGSLGQIPGQNLLGGQGGLAGQGLGGQGLGGQRGLAGQGVLGAVQGALAGLQGGAGGLGQTNGAGGQTGANGDAENAAGADQESGSNGAASSASGSAGQGSGASSGSGFNGPTFGGGPILGVASTSKAKGVHVFFDKEHYNDWLFIYLAQGDMGGLLVGPVQPGAPTGGGLGGIAPGQVGGLPGQGQGLVPNNGIQSQSATPTPQNSGLATPQQ